MEKGKRYTEIARSIPPETVNYNYWEAQRLFASNALHVALTKRQRSSQFNKNQLVLPIEPEFDEAA